MNAIAIRTATPLVCFLSLALSGCDTGYMERVAAEREVLETNRRLECAKDENNAWPRFDQKNLYIQGSILWLFTAPQSSKLTQAYDDHLRWGQVHSSDVVKFLLENNLRSLEIDMRAHGGLGKRIFFGYEFPADLYRVYVSEEGDPFCKNYHEQYKYRRQALPDMRRLGLGPGSCIAVKEISEPAAELHIVADLEPKEAAEATRAVVSAVDYSDPRNPVIQARSSALFSVDSAHGNYGSGDYFARCGSSIEVFSNIKSAIWGDRDSSGNTHRLAESLPPEESTKPPRTGTEADATAFVQWVGRKIDLTDSFDATGTIWSEDLYRRTPTGATNLSGKAINFFVDGRVLSRPLVLTEYSDRADVYKTGRQARRINVALVKHRGLDSEQHLWIVLDEGLNQLDSVLLSKADLDKAEAREANGNKVSTQPTGTRP